MAAEQQRWSRAAAAQSSHYAAAAGFLMRHNFGEHTGLLQTPGNELSGSGLISRWINRAQANELLREPYERLFVYIGQSAFLQIHSVLPLGAIPVLVYGLGAM